MIQFTNKITTTKKELDTGYKTVWYGISDNVSILLQNGKYSAINTAIPTTIDYNVIKLLSEPCTFQYYKTVYMEVIKASELISEAEYPSIMRSNTHWSWQQLDTKDSVIIATCTIFHPFLDVSTIKYVADIPRSLWDSK